MELTKAQITEVEEYLKAKGVKYWDIRIEMLDHIATDIEQRMELESSFEEAKKEALKEKGWSGSIDDILFKRMQSVNRKVRGRYLREFGRLFTHFSSLSLIILSSLFLVILYYKIDYRVSLYISMSLYVIPIVIALFFVVKSLIFKKSAYMQYGNFYMLFSFIMLNLIVQIGKDLPVSENTAKWIYLSVAIINALSIYAGAKTYLSVRKEVQQMQKQLKLL